MYGKLQLPEVTPVDTNLAQDIQRFVFLVKIIKNDWEQNGTSSRTDIYIFNDPNSPFSEDVYRQAWMVHYQFILLKIARTINILNVR